MAEVVSHAHFIHFSLLLISSPLFMALLIQIAAQEQSMPDRKPRKSVVFSDDNTLIDENGGMTTTQDTGDDKTTADSHTSGA